jgi:uncharacterized peroxidase-related enzyme
MPFIPVEEHLPGITGLLEYRKDTAKPIRELTQFLLRGPSTLTKTERELIATVVSSGNECTFCTAAHAAAISLLSGDQSLADDIRKDHSKAKVSDKMKSLLNIAAAVRVSGKSVSAGMIEKAKAEGATDVEIHDTVLIASLFCLYNRYVDGLGTALPRDASYYQTLADRIVNHGYTRLPQGYDHLKKQQH